jgi:hypothetical protein
MKNGFVFSLSVLLIALFSASSRAVEAPSAVTVTSIATSGMPRTYIYPKGSYRWFSVTCAMNPSWGLECDANWVDPDFGFWALRLNRRTWVSGTESVRSAHFESYARRRMLRLWSVAGWGERFASTRRAAGTSTEGKRLPPTPEGRKEWLPVSCGFRERVPFIRDRPGRACGDVGSGRGRRAPPSWSSVSEERRRFRLCLAALLRGLLRVGRKA